MTASWRLPQGITDISFGQATQLHYMTTCLVTQYQSYGYQLVLPPIAEYENTKINQDSFKALDPASGEMLAIQSDITPQIARIDAKYENNNKIMRYCYVQGMLRTRSDDFYSSRNPIQAGVEIYGCLDYLADLEVIELMIKSLKIIGLQEGVLLSLGHIGILNELMTKLFISDEQINQLKTIFANRSKPDLDNFVNQLNIDPDLVKDLLDLMDYEGGIEILDKAKLRYQNHPRIIKILNSMGDIVTDLKANNIEPYIDLAEFKPQGYYTGLLFSCVHQDYSRSLAQGGRYDNLSQGEDQNTLFNSTQDQNNTSRDATGFSLDLKFLTSSQVLTKNKLAHNKSILFAPKKIDAKLKIFIEQLRQNNQVVIRQFDQTKSNDFEFKNNQWHTK